METKSIYHRHPVVTQSDRTVISTTTGDVYTVECVSTVCVNQGFTKRKDCSMVI